MTILTIKIPAAQFDSYRDAVNAVHPDTIGVPAPYTDNETRPATHYLIDLPVSESIRSTLRSELPANGQQYVRRGSNPDGAPTTTGMQNVANQEGLKRIETDNG